MSLRAAQLVVLFTGFIAFTSILVAGMLAVRLDRTRGALHQAIQQCGACCQDLRAGQPAPGAP